MNQHDSTSDRGLEFLGLRVHRTVFPCAVTLIVLAVIVALLDPVGFNAHVAGLRGGILQHFDSFIMIMGNLFVVLCVVLALSPLGRVRLGGPQATPQFGFVSWFSMLFAAGMGIGVLPEGAAQDFTRLIGLRIIRIEDDWARRRMLLVVRDIAGLPAVGRKLVERLARSAV